MGEKMGEKILSFRKKMKKKKKMKKALMEKRGKRVWKCVMNKGFLALKGREGNLFPFFTF